MNAKIYSGPNRLENWLIAQRTTSSPLRNFTRKSNPEKIVVDERSTLRAARDVTYLKDNLVTVDDDTYWEDMGGLIGGVVFAGIYSLSYPITFIDGPLPIVDAAWAFGLVRFTRSGHAIGSEIGSWFD